MGFPLSLLGCPLPSTVGQHRPSKKLNYIINYETVEATEFGWRGRHFQLASTVLYMYIVRAQELEVIGRALFWALFNNKARPTTQIAAHYGG